MRICTDGAAVVPETMYVYFAASRISVVCWRIGAVAPESVTVTWRWPASTLWYVETPSNGRLLTTGSTNTMRSIGPPSSSALKTRTLAGSVPKKLLPLLQDASRTAANASASTPSLAATACARRVRLMGEERRNGQIAAGSLYLQS